MTTKFDNYVQAMYWYEYTFARAARIVEGDCYDWVTQPNGVQDYRRTYQGRAWFSRERSKYPLHPAVMQLMRIYKPDDWQQLLLEWPHRSESDPNRLAYTRDERSGEADRQVVTTIGKYLHRHFSYAPDDMIRDIVAQHTYGGRIVLVRELQEMVNAVINGPRSCMSKDFCIRCDDGGRRHPYAVYDPSLGWSMAVRYDHDERVLGRCLVFEGEADGDNHKVFVRSYKRERDEMSHSGADEAIESWLKAQGYTKHSYWPDGTPLKRYGTTHGGYLMPYIDGGTQNVDEDSFTINGDGSIDASTTDGTANSGNCTCEACGARFDDNHEGGWAGRHEDYHVCQNCLDDDYTYAYSRRGNQYYITNDNVVEVGGEYYDIEYLSDNSIVELANGDYEHIDNAVYIDSEDEYYHVDDYDICYAEDTGEYELRNHCWQCTESGNWYTDDEESVEIDGELYHPDNAPEVAAEEDDNTETN
jgi:hypothetical protein